MCLSLWGCFSLCWLHNIFPLGRNEKQCVTPCVLFNRSLVKSDNAKTSFHNQQLTALYSWVLSYVIIVNQIRVQITLKSSFDSYYSKIWSLLNIGINLLRQLLFTKYITLLSEYFFHWPFWMLKSDFTKSSYPKDELGVSLKRNWDGRLLFLYVKICLCLCSLVCINSIGLLLCQNNSLTGIFAMHAL